MSVPVISESIRFIVRLTAEGWVSFRRDQGCGQAATLAICRAITGGRTPVCDVTPTEVDDLAASRLIDDPYWREDLLLQFSARQHIGGLIEIERDCGCNPDDVLDLCESLLDTPHLDELDDTHYHRHIAKAG